MMTFDHIFRKINVCAFEQTRTDSTSSELLKYMIDKNLATKSDERVREGFRVIGNRG